MGVKRCCATSATCATTRLPACGASSERFATVISKYELDSGERGVRLDNGLPKRRVRGGGLHGYVAAIARQFQCARSGNPRRGTVCIPQPDSRRHSHERRLPRTAHHDHSERKLVESRLSGSGGRRQRRNLAMCHGCLVWRAGCSRCIAGHDEQLEFRQRPRAVLRDDCRRRGVPDPHGTARTPCTRT